MKLVGIDVDALKRRYEELEAEMGHINQILAIAENTYTAIPGVTVTERAHKERAVNNSGIRKICLLQLYTGPCTVESVARVTNQEFGLVKSCLRSCVTVGLSTEGPYNGSKPGVFTLTQKGMTMAKWHTEHPQAVVYAGDKL